MIIKTKMKIRKRTNFFLQQTILNIVASSSSIAMSNTTAMIDYNTVYIAGKLWQGLISNWRFGKFSKLNPPISDLI